MIRILLVFFAIFLLLDSSAQAQEPVAVSVPCKSNIDCIKALGAPPPCTTYRCIYHTSQCDPVPFPLVGGWPCDDGDACTTGTRCKAGKCQGGTKTTTPDCDADNAIAFCDLHAAAPGDELFCPLRINLTGEGTRVPTGLTISVSVPEGLRFQGLVTDRLLMQGSPEAPVPILVTVTLKTTHDTDTDRLDSGHGVTSIPLSPDRFASAKSATVLLARLDDPSAPLGAEPLKFWFTALAAGDYLVLASNIAGTAPIGGIHHHKTLMLDPDTTAGLRFREEK